MSLLTKPTKECYAITLDSTSAFFCNLPRFFPLTCGLDHLFKKMISFVKTVKKKTTTTFGQ